MGQPNNGYPAGIRVGINLFTFVIDDNQLISRRTCDGEIFTVVKFGGISGFHL